ncbi:MAG TPA: TRAP transporter substrate-binding protein, partial [Rhodospirillaceae bacterium]|nr:TRAP transporter substrate-binding protein [Rhodospirillaceae bacterium]
MHQLNRSIAALSIMFATSLATPAMAQTDITWGTSAVGSSGHRALVNLSTVLNKEMKDYQVTVQPMPGAIVSVKSYAAGKTLGYYGADIAF